MRNASSRMEKDTRAWLAATAAHVVELPEQSIPIAWGLLTNFAGDLVPPTAISQRPAADKVEMQLIVPLSSIQIAAYETLGENRVPFLLDLYSLLCARAVEHRVEEAPSLRQIRIFESVYADAWSKDRFWRRLLQLRFAAMSTGIFLAQRLGFEETPAPFELVVH